MNHYRKDWMGVKSDGCQSMSILMKWEYDLRRLHGIVSPRDTETSRMLREAGNDGWEAVSVWTQEQKGPLAGHETLILFKRPVPTGENSDERSNRR